MADNLTSYSVENDSIFYARIREAQAALDDLRVPFGLIGMDFYRSEKAIFQLKGPGLFPPFTNSQRQSHHFEMDGVGTRRVEGKDHETDKSPYQKRKIAKYGFDYPLLVASGKLAASMTQPNGPGSIYLVTKLSLTIGTNIQYGIYHQSDAPRSKIPLRKFIFIGPEAPRFATSDQMGRLQRWLGYMDDFIKRQVTKQTKG